MNGILEPELAGKTKEDGELCMESYKWSVSLIRLSHRQMLELACRLYRAFNACRIPASPSDYAIKTAETDSDAQHFVIVKKNRFYSVPVCDGSGQEFDVDQLRAYVSLSLLYIKLRLTCLASKQSCTTDHRRSGEPRESCACRNLNRNQSGSLDRGKLSPCDTVQARLIFLAI